MDAEVKAVAHELQTREVEVRRLFGALHFRKCLREPRHDPREPQRGPQVRMRQTHRIGDRLDEFSLRHELAVREIVRLPNRLVFFRGQEDGVDQIVHEDRVERSLAASGIAQPAFTQALDDAWHHGAVARAVNEARPQNRHGDAEFLIVVQRELLGFDLRLRVAVAMPAWQRHGFVGAVVMPRRIDAEAAHVDETRQALPFARVEQDA